MKVFIAGIMQGSKQGAGIHGQDYRRVIGDAVRGRHPEAQIVDPFALHPDSVAYGDGRAKEVLFALAAEAGSADVVIADTSVAPHHAELIVTADGRFHLTDCASESGTWRQSADGAGAPRWATRCSCRRRSSS